MDMRTRIGTALKEAMKSKDAARLSTLRLINAAIKDKDIALRTVADSDGVGDPEVLAILGKMVKQRQESARAYEEGGRLDLSERELAEIVVIEDFLPRPLTEDEVSAAVEKAIRDSEASSIRDMGRVMASLKSEYTGRIDFGRVGPMVKDRLAGSGA